MEALKGGGEVTLKVPRAVGLYILNEKRAYLSRVHQLHGLYVTIQIDDAMAHADHEIERTALGQHSSHALEQTAAVTRVYEPEDDLDEVFEEEEEEEEDEELEEAAESEEGEERAPREDDERSGGRGRRRRGGRGRDESREPREPHEPNEAADAAPREEQDEDGDGRGRRRRRGRRGGRRVREEGGQAEGFAWARPRVPFGEDAFQWHDPAALDPALNIGDEAANDTAPAPALEVVADTAAPAEGAEEVWVELPAEPEGGRRPRRRGGRGRGKAEAEPAAEPVAEAAPEPEPQPEPEPVATEEAAPKPKRTRKPKAEKVAEPVAEAAPQPEATPEPEPAPAPKKKAAAPKEPDPAEISTPPAAPRKGWWRRG